VFSALLLCVSLAHCGDDGTAECQSNLNWRSPTAGGGVACKGAPGCLCDGGQVCSITVEDKSESPWSVSARCTALADAKDMAFQCDGPEDCATGQVCCADLVEGGGSSCVAERDCSGIGSERVMCRSTDDCTFPGHTCKPADAGSFFAGVVGYCD
jgi:hypothetical protein